MLVYLFRITTDEQEDFLREIEIQPKQSFLDFHVILTESAELLHCNRASFFITDKKYKKDKEITLKSEKRMVRKYDEDLDQVVTENISFPLMKNSVLKNFIEDPHQKMIYEFEGREHHAFFIELFRILKSDGIPSYPRCVKQKGDLPRKPVHPVAPPPEEVVPAAEIPKIVVPSLGSLSKLDHIVEDEAELAEIESQLSAITIEENGHDFGITEPGSDDPEEISFEGTEVEEGEMDHLEEYEDIDNIENGYSGYDRDSDDY